MLVTIRCEMVHNSGYHRRGILLIIYGIKQKDLAKKGKNQYQGIV